jgi:quercetin dioxygenase-like cupin family protein
MQRTNARPGHARLTATVAFSAAIGIAIGAIGSRSLAEMAAPTEHRGLTVDALGIIPEDSMQRQIGLSGYKLQLREITIAPGGQIAKHSHESRPGLVKVISGTWTEGRPSGETEFVASEPIGILEDGETVHWFWNRGSEPAAAIVCDIVAAE